MGANARFLRWLAALAVCCAALAASAQSPGDWRARQLEASRQSEQIMHDAEARKGLLARLETMQQAYAGNRDEAFRLIFGQYLSWYQSFAGDYPAAAESFSIKQVALPDDHPAPSPADGYTPRKALDAIVQLARGRQLVLLNEAHNVAQTRSLSVQLLAPLRAAGFNYLAVETLYATDKALATRGYPIEDSGFYTAEPVCAELVRTALRLGFHVVAYEATDNVTGDAREAAQARNIQREVFARDPHARLIVAAGYGHIQKSGAYLGGNSMAWHLHKLSGIDGLAVEQTMLIPHPHASDNHPTYDALVAASAISVPTVFVNADGKPWALRDGYDVSVIFPPLVLRRGRPTWLALDGLRVPYVVGAERCGMHIPCLVEARYAAEGEDAIPADRLVLSALPQNAVSSNTARGTDTGQSSGVLYLRPGAYRLRFSDIDARTLFRQDIRVDPPAAAR
jgi:hypothetical protein